MTTDNGVSFETETSPVNGAAGSQIIPEKLVEHTEAFREAMIELVTPTAPNEAAQVIGPRLEKVTHSLGLLYQDANSSARSSLHLADDAFRRHFELGMRFLEEVVHVKTPVEAIALQFNYFKSQMELAAEHWQQMQGRFATAFQTPWQKAFDPAAFKKD